VTWDMPTEKKCPQCESMLVQKNTAQKGSYLHCTGADCKYKEQVLKD
jgi:DNA topoisomerase-1